MDKFKFEFTKRNVNEMFNVSNVRQDITLDITNTLVPIGTARKNGVKFDDDWKDRKSFLEKNEAGRRNPE